MKKEQKNNKYGRRNMEKSKKKNAWRMLVSVFLVCFLIFDVLPIQKMKITSMAKTTEVTLQNPRIIEDSSMEAGQKVTWDCIWFGSYPQAEVVPSGNYIAIESKYLQEGDTIVNDGLYTSLKNCSNWDSNGDVKFNGEKYRRIKKSDAIYSGISSTYMKSYNWSDENTYHYFKYEPIKWRVLNIDGKNALLLADRVLDDRQYNTQNMRGMTVTWEDSTIRSFLNGYDASQNQEKIDYENKQNFINTAFEIDEVEAIVSKTIKNDSMYINRKENDTIDKVFLLSDSEICETDKAISYGFISDRQESDEARRGSSSVYAKAMGSQWNSSSKYNLWWLRSSAGNSNGGAWNLYIGSWGTIGSDGGVDCDYFGIRPCINLELKYSNIYTYAGTVCSDGTDTEQGKDSASGNDSNNSGKSEENDFFKLKVDTNQFVHHNLPYHIDDFGYRLKLFRSMSTWFQLYQLNKYYNGEGGVCHGIATSMCYGNQGYIDFRDISSDAKNYWELGSPEKNSKLKDILVYYQLLQISSNATKTLDKGGWHPLEAVKNYRVKKFFGDFVKEAKKSQELRKPFIFSYRDIEKVGHSVVVCGYKWNSVNKCHEIKIYDENSYENGECETYTMTISESLDSLDFADFNCRNADSPTSLQDIWSSLNYYGIDNIYNNLNILNVADTLYSTDDLEQSSKTTIQITNGKKFRLENNEGKWLAYDGENYTGDMIVYDCYTSGMDGSLWSIIIDSSSSLVLKDADVNCQLIASIDGKGYAVSSDGAESIQIRSDGVAANGASYKLDVSIQSNACDFLQVKSNVNGEISINEKEDKLVIDSTGECRDTEVYSYDNAETQELDIKNKDGIMEVDTKQIDKVYYINYNLNGGEVTGNPITYTKSMETFVLKNPIRTGYIFKGWTGSNGNVPQTTVTISKGTIGDLFYHANWEKKSVIEGEDIVLRKIIASKKKTAYYMGEKISIKDLYVMAYYSDGSSELLDDDDFYTNSSLIKTTKAGYKMLQIVYEEDDVEKSCKIKIKILELPPPKKVKAEALGKRINIKYKKIKAADGYAVFYGSSKKLNFSKVVYTKKTKVKLKIKKWKSGNYYIKVRAYKLNGSIKILGKSSSVIKVKKKKR